MREAKVAIGLMKWLNERSKIEYPNWEYRDLDLERILILEKALGEI